MHGVRGQAGGIVGVGVAAGNAKDALGRDLVDLVGDSAGFALIVQATGQALDQPAPSVGSLEEHGTAVGTAVLEVEANREGLAKEPWKDQTLCRTITEHREPPEWASVFINRFVPRRRLFLAHLS